MIREKVGMLTLPAREGVLKTFEYAGAGEIWNLDEATIPLVYDGYWILGSRPGTCVESWFQNRIGACYGSDNRNKEPRPGVLGLQLYTFDVAKYVLDGSLVLEPEWECVQIGEYSDGKPMYNIRKKK